MAATYLEDRASEILTAATNALTLARTGNAIPSRIYRSHGAPAADLCSADGLLTVYMDAPALRLMDVRADRTHQVGQRKAVPSARYVVELWRCVRTVDERGNPPSATALDSSAEGLMRDLHALWTGLALAKFAGTLVSVPTYADPTIAEPMPRPPQGGAAGWLIRIETPIDDEGPAL